MKKMVLILLTILLTSCNTTAPNPVKDTIPETITSENPGFPTLDANVLPTTIPTLIPTIIPSATDLPIDKNLPEYCTGLTIVPFNYRLTDLGDGWNYGMIDLAVENKTQSIYDGNSLIRDMFAMGHQAPWPTVETSEGPVYEAGYDISDGGTTEVVLFPGFRYFSELGSGITIWWKSAVATTPSKIIFTICPNWNFSIPTQKEQMITFPYDNPPYQINSFSELSGEYLVNETDGISAMFTGKCVISDGAYAYFEMDMKNNDPYYDHETFIYEDILSYGRDGYYMYYEDLSYVIIGEKTGWQDEEYALGPGVSEKAYIRILPSQLGQPLPIILMEAGFSDTRDFFIFDLNECEVTSLNID
jgi:hypothetical protein